MKTFSFYRLVILLLVFSSAAASQTKIPPPASRRVSANAALKYLRAYAAIQQSNGLTPDTSALIENYLTVSLDSQAAKLVAAAEDGLRELHHGAALKYCDWEISSEDGLATDMSHRGAARVLIAVAGLRARLRFGEGRPSEAAADLLDAITLARHLSLDGSLASPLIANTLEQGPVSLLALHLPHLRAGDLRLVAARYNSLPPGEKLADALLSHEKISRELFNHMLEGVGGRDDLIKRLSSLAPFKAGGAAEFLDACSGTAEGIMRNVTQLRPQYLRWARWFTLPPEQFEKKYDAESAELIKTNPVFRLLTPSADRIRWAEAYRQTQRALLRAAIAVQQNGAGALHRYPDPYDGRSFKHVATGEGFQLRSHLKQNDKPLEISIGS